MIKQKEIQQTIKVDTHIICDVCKKEYSNTTENIAELQEFKHLRFTGGFSSVFGDMVDNELDICQHCLKEKLGQFFRQVNIESDWEHIQDK